MTAPFDIRALKALPIGTAPSSWLAPATLAARIGVAPDVARSVLVRFRTGGFAEDDGAVPPAVAWTAKGDRLIKQQQRLEQPQ